MSYSDSMINIPLILCGCFYKLGDEEIKPGCPIEYMENGWWNVGLFEKDRAKPMKFYIVDIKANKKDMELKGLKLRLR